MRWLWSGTIKPICPNCKKAIPPDDVNVQADVVYCTACNEAFTLSALVEGDEERVERPLVTKSVLIREAERLAIALPRGGFKGVGCFFTFFTLFWNGITWTFVIVMLSELFSAPSGQPLPAESGGTPGDASQLATDGLSNSFDAFGLLFMIPFIIIGVVTALIALYCLFGETSLAINRETGLLRRKLFFLKYDKTFLLSDITGVGWEVAYRQNDSPVHGVGIKLGNRSRPLVFGSGLAEDEQKWLISEINAFWKEMTRTA